MRYGDPYVLQLKDLALYDSFMAQRIQLVVTRHQASCLYISLSL